jgi:segregation and condensation protein B
MTDKSLPQEELTLEQTIEALLFAAPGSTAPAQLAEVLAVPLAKIEQALQHLAGHYQEDHGLSLQWHNGRVQLTTSALAAEKIEKFLGLDVSTRLSRAALETLAIVAYRQPITRPGIDSIRGVSSDGVLKSLLSKGLLQEIGRAEGPGRPILYGVTAEFLQHFGLSALDQLPSFEIHIEESDEEPKNGILKD